MKAFIAIYQLAIDGASGTHQATIAISSISCDKCSRRDTNEREKILTPIGERRNPARTSDDTGAGQQNGTDILLPYGTTLRTPIHISVHPTGVVSHHIDVDSKHHANIDHYAKLMLKLTSD
uniref:Uncharacterized protein n=1 Tax=Glossina austeni TaxID=7395 RepID=A0A1A9UIA6_GLOAU